MIIGSLVEVITTTIIITIKAGLYRCLLIFLHVHLHLWEPVTTIVIVIVGITEVEGGIIIEDRTLLVVVVIAARNYLTSLQELL